MLSLSKNYILELKVKISKSNIRELLANEQKLILNCEDINYSKEEIYQLIKELPDLYIIEIRPIRTITIEQGTHSKDLLILKDQILMQIDDYNNTRREVFNSFMKNNGIKRGDGELGALKIKLQNEGFYPKGKFGNWKYWVHGTDMEFENEKDRSHFNISFGNYEHLNHWSLLKFIKAFTNDRSLQAMTEKDMIKFLDLMIIESELEDKESNFPIKIITRKQKP